MRKGLITVALLLGLWAATPAAQNRFWVLFNGALQYTGTVRVLGPLLGSTTFTLGATTSTSAGASIRATKLVTGIANNTATTILTWSAPNAEVSALIKINVAGILGAGGAIGEGECARSIEFLLTVTRTAGVNAVSAAASASEDTGAAAVAGAATCTIARSLVAVSGTTTAVNTQQVQVTIAAGTGSSSNHIAVVEYSVINNTANGVTIS